MPFRILGDLLGRVQSTPFGSVASVTYLLRDDFNYDLAAGSVNGTAAVPGPGTRVVVDTNNKISVGSGFLDFATGAVINDGLWLDNAQARTAGRFLVAKMTLANTDGAPKLGWDINTSGAIKDSLRFAASAEIKLRVDGAVAIVIGAYTAASHTVAAVMRATGLYWFIKGGAFTNWKLLWFSAAGSASGYPVIGNNGIADVFTSSFLRVPTETWLPTPLAYDAFGRGDGAIGSSEVSGPDAQATPQRVWTGVGATISSNKAIITPTQGSDLITNGNFANWTSDDPDNWTVDGESGDDPEVSEAATGEAHADTPTAGGGMCNIYTSDGTAVWIRTNADELTLDEWYSGTIDLDTVTAGGVIIQFGNGAGAGTTKKITSTGVVPFTGRQTGGSRNFYVYRGTTEATDVTFDDVVVKQLTLSTLFSSLSVGQQDVVADVDLVVTSDTQAGLVLCLDDASSPANFLIAWHDGSNAHLEKCVAGTYTSLINTAATYSSGATLRVVKDGTSVSLFYNNAKVGTTQTVSDAGVKDNTIHGFQHIRIQHYGQLHLVPSRQRQRVPEAGRVHSGVDMKAFAIIRMSGGSPDIEELPIHGYVLAFHTPNYNWGGYLLSGTGPQLNALNSLPQVFGIVAVTEDGDVRWAELEGACPAAVRDRLNTWLTNRGYPNIPSGWTYRRVIREIFQRVNEHFDLDAIDVADVP
jgi:hypothetical protein